jgi:hypothetical protein
MNCPPTAPRGTLTVCEKIPKRHCEKRFLRRGNLESYSLFCSAVRRIGRSLRHRHPVSYPVDLGAKLIKCGPSSCCASAVVGLPINAVLLIALGVSWPDQYRCPKCIGITRAARLFLVNTYPVQLVQKNVPPLFRNSYAVNVAGSFPTVDFCLNNLPTFYSMKLKFGNRLSVAVTVWAYNHNITLASSATGATDSPNIYLSQRMTESPMAPSAPLAI